MPTTDPRVDTYIEKAADFARPILIHMRGLVHETCPEVKETIKWGLPTFEYKGILAGMAAFKAHATFGFWKHSLLGLGSRKDLGAMGSFGKMTSITDLPDDATIKRLLKEAVRLNDEGIKVEKRVTKAKKPLVVPDVLLEALAKNDKAAETFNNFTYSKKKDYVEWIAEAKTDATRDKRLATTIEWLAEGKSRMWKYERC
ncbi:MAG: YdeI/OmpD-associated family protein [Pyrinomonadaceae bacterium]